MFNTIVSVAQAISAGVGGMLMSKMSAKSQAAYAKAGGIAEENLVSTGILGCFLSRPPPESNEACCVLNQLHRFTMASPTAAPTATSRAYC